MLEINYKYFKDYLEITISGEFTKDLPKEVNPEFIMKKCKKKGINKVLMNGLKVTGNISTFDRFNIAKIYAHSLLGGNIKFSMVANTDIINPNSFFETVATNRGINVKVFIDLEKAKKWLLS